MGESKRRAAAKAAAKATLDTTQAPPASSEEWLARARHSHAAGQFADAARHYGMAAKLALAGSPEAVRALHFQGLALYQDGMADVGVALMRQGADALPGDGELQFNLALALKARGARQEARARLETTLARSTLDAEGYALLAELCAQAGEHDDAIAHAAEAARLSPVPEHWHRAILYAWQAGRNVQAQALWHEGVEHTPQLAEHCRVGLALPEDDLLPPLGDWHEVPLPLSAARQPELATRAALDAFAAARDLHVIDDVLADPLAYRDWALAQDFRPTAYLGQNFPGLQTRGHAPDAIMRLIARVLGRPVRWISPDVGALRLSYHDASARTDIHVDRDSDEDFAHYAAVLYLNLPEQAQGGTLFWRHAPSGWEARPPQAELVAAGYTGYKAFETRWLSREQLLPFNALRARHDGAWAPLVELPMRHNRLVFYRSHFFHSIGEVFGSTPQDGRLVQLFAFEPV